MNLDAAAIAKVTAAFKPKAYKRIFPVAHQQTPLGTGPGKARFSSADGNFHTLYAAASLAAAIAETLIRDRFEGVATRTLFSSELQAVCVAQITASAPLKLIDLRTDGCFQLGISTDVAGAKGEAESWAESRALAQHIHDHTELDGFLYRSRLTGTNCIAVFDRAISPKLTAGASRPLTATQGLVAALGSLNVEVVL